MINKVKLDQRINHSKIDNDILENINACKKDLQRVGISKIDDEDFLIIQAVKLYCRWKYNFENQSEKHKRDYEELRNALTLCGDYKDV